MNSSRFPTFNEAEDYLVNKGHSFISERERYVNQFETARILSCEHCEREYAIVYYKIGQNYKIAYKRVSDTLECNSIIVKDIIE